MPGPTKRQRDSVLTLSTDERCFRALAHSCLCVTVRTTDRLLSGIALD